MNDKNNIGNNGFLNEVDEHSLLQYLEGNMPHAQQHALEAALDSDPFLNDAIDGLYEVKDPAQLRAIAAQINAQLKRNIKNKRAQRRSRKKAVDNWGAIFVLIILLVVLICWIVMKATTK